MIDREEFGWRYRCYIGPRVAPVMEWCKANLGPFGEKWSVRFLINNEFMFKRHEDYVIFVLAWNEQIIKKY